MAYIASNNSTYDIAGTSGPVVVLIHGLGVNRHMWQWQIHQFAQKYRVVTYDLFGHGESPLPQISPSLALYSSQLRELLDERNRHTVASMQSVQLDLQSGALLDLCSIRPGL
mgnify:CR=1 FL=1